MNVDLVLETNNQLHGFHPEDEQAGVPQAPTANPATLENEDCDDRNEDCDGREVESDAMPVVEDEEEDDEDENED